MIWSATRSLTGLRGEHGNHHDMATYHEKLAEYDRLPQPLEERVIVTKSELLHQIELRKQDLLEANGLNKLFFD